MVLKALNYMSIWVENISKLVLNTDTHIFLFVLLPEEEVNNSVKTEIVTLIR